MTEQFPNVISIGYGRNMFDSTNVERIRMEHCAAETASLHMIIFTKNSDSLRPAQGFHNLFLYPTSSRSKISMVIDAFAIARTIIKKNPDKRFLVTTQDPFEAGMVGYLLKKFYGVKLIVQEHGDVFATDYWRKESWLNQIRYFLGLSILSKADVVRVVSMRTRKYFTTLGLRSLTLLPVAIDTTRFQSATPSPLIRQIFPVDTFVFLSVARFVPQKNLTLLLRAFHRAHTANPNIRLLLVGSGVQERLLKQTAQKLFGSDQNAISFLPWSNDVTGLMKASDAYVLSSNYEGWGRVLIEAMVAGLPIVTTDVGCAHEVVQNEVHGLIVPTGDEELLARAMVRMASDETFYSSIRQTLATLSVNTIPGTNLDTYGREWVKTLEN